MVNFNNISNRIIMKIRYSDNKPNTIQKEDKKIFEKYISSFENPYALLMYEDPTILDQLQKFEEIDKNNNIFEEFKSFVKDKKEKGTICKYKIRPSELVITLKEFELNSKTENIIINTHLMALHKMYSSSFRKKFQLTNKRHFNQKYNAFPKLACLDYIKYLDDGSKIVQLVCGKNGELVKPYRITEFGCFKTFDKFSKKYKFNEEIGILEDENGNEKPCNSSYISSYYTLSNCSIINCKLKDDQIYSFNIHELKIKPIIERIDNSLLYNIELNIENIANIDNLDDILIFSKNNKNYSKMIDVAVKKSFVNSFDKIQLNKMLQN